MTKPPDPPSDTPDDTLADHDVPEAERKTQTDLEYQAAAAVASTRREVRDTEPSPFADAGVTETASLTDELDLHTFQPAECADVVEEYVRAAHEAGMTSVRIIHGKGTGTLRRIVHGVLERHAAVASFKLADERAGSWGATLVELRPPDHSP